MKDVREIIIEIMASHDKVIACATEIENIILMFIDWLVKEVTVKLVWKDGIGYVKQWQYEPAGWRHANSPYYSWTTSELFSHWYEKIYNK